MANEYGWIDFYTELADKLLPYKGSRPELIRKIRQVYANVGIKRKANLIKFPHCGTWQAASSLPSATSFFW